MREELKKTEKEGLAFGAAWEGAVGLKVVLMLAVAIGSVKPLFDRSKRVLPNRSKCTQSMAVLIGMSVLAVAFTNEHLRNQ